MILLSPHAIVLISMPYGVGLRGRYVTCISPVPVQKTMVSSQTRYSPGRHADCHVAAQASSRCLVRWYNSDLLFTDGLLSFTNPLNPGMVMYYQYRLNTASRINSLMEVEEAGGKSEGQRQCHSMLGSGLIAIFINTPKNYRNVALFQGISPQDVELSRHQSATSARCSMYAPRGKNL